MRIKFSLRFFKIKVALKILKCLRRHSVTPCKVIQKSLEFRNPQRGFRIPCLWIPDSTSMDSGFHNQQPGFWITITVGLRNSLAGFRIPKPCTPDSTRIPQTKITWIPDSGLPYMVRILSSTHRNSSRWNDHVVNVSVKYFPSSPPLNTQQTVLRRLYASINVEIDFFAKGNIPIRLDRGLMNAIFSFQGNRSRNRSALYTTISERKEGLRHLLLFSFSLVLLYLLIIMFHLQKLMYICYER